MFIDALDDFVIRLSIHLMITKAKPGDSTLCQMYSAWICHYNYEKDW